VEGVFIIKQVVELDDSYSFAIAITDIAIDELRDN